MKIGYFPYDSTGNDYVINMRRILGKKGKVLPVKNRLSLIFKRKKYDYIFVNWRENYFIDKQGNLALLGVIKEFIRIFYFKLIAKKLCFVVHNHYPHATKLEALNKVKFVQNKYRSLYDTLICHSGENQQGTVYIPHPCYAIPAANNNAIQKRDLPNKYSLIFGRIERYKKIEQAIQSMPKSEVLVICGKCNDLDYLNTLISLSSSKQVILINEFIEHEELISLITNAKAVILPSDSEEMIVSGSFHFAMSCGATIYTVTTPYMAWYQENYGTTSLICKNSVESIWDSISRNESATAKDTQYIDLHSDNNILQHLDNTIFGVS